MKTKITACVWRNGSTDKKSMKSTLPTFYHEMKCDGVLTETIMRSCRRYIPDKKEGKNEKM